MIYTRTITSPFAHSPTTTIDTVFKLTDGFIYQLDIYLPQGSQGLLKIAIRDHKAQLYPNTPGEWFFGDGIQVSFPESHELNEEPFELLIRHYNEDSAYDHSFQIRIGLLTKDLFIARFLPQLGAQQILDTLEKYKEAEAISKTEQLEASRKQLLLNLGIGGENVVE